MTLPLDIDLSQIPPDQLAEAVYQSLKAQITTLSDTDALFKKVRADKAAESNAPEGFGHFYYVIYGRECPKFAMEQWIPALYKAKEQGKGMMLKSWRGSTKSTIMLAFCAYQLGWRPEGSGIFVAANDGAANKLAASLSLVIEFISGWKMVFPHVVPDKTRGWGAEGYFIKDTRRDYNEFVEATLTDHLKDPAFIGAGVTGGKIVGTHPSVFMSLDDIHDEDNTSSKAMREEVIEKITSNLLPTISRPGKDKPFIAVAYTPWTNDDAYVYLESTELLDIVSTPMYQDIDNERIFAWPEWFGADTIDKYRKATKTERNFKRMYLCDISSNDDVSLKYYSFPAQETSYSWPIIGGVDPINTAPTKSTEPTSNFALAYVAKLPMGGAVVLDGVLKKCTDVEAEMEITNAQRIFPGWLFSAVENVGGGALFVQILRRNPKLRIVASDLQAFSPQEKGRIRSKRDRFLHQAAPWFERGVVKISDADTPFLNALRRLFTQFYDLDPKTAPEFDAGDSVYHALKAMPDVLQIADDSKELPTPGLKKKKSSQAALMFGRLR